MPEISHTADTSERSRDHDHGKDDAWSESAFASRYTSAHVPKDRLPEEEMPSHIAYQLVSDMRTLDCNPRLDLASFVTTWMEPEAGRLMMESLAVNHVDMEQYPSSTEMQNRCVTMLTNLYHGECDNNGIGTGTATIGSSEAIMLGGLAMKKAWQAKRKAAGKPYDKPNLVMGYEVQVCWEKFTRYFDVEEKFVHLTTDCFVMTPEKMIEAIDENTIGVCAILGSTYTGEYEDIEKMDRLIGELNKKTGWDVPIHVDAASGGFVAPFIFPDLKWDFQLPNVKSINVSGHKYGLVYAGLGWILFRNRAALPEELIFHTNYLGSDQPSVTLNFSKGASNIIAQYYMFLRLGFRGYKKIMSNLMTVTQRLQEGILETGHFTILSHKEKGLPLVAFSLNDTVEKDGKHHKRNYSEYDIADRLRMHHWFLPAYTMAPDAGEVKLLRCVVREDLSMGMVDNLVADIRRVVDQLDKLFVFTDKEVDVFAHRLHVQNYELKDDENSKQNGVC